MSKQDTIIRISYMTVIGGLTGALIAIKLLERSF